MNNRLAKAFYSTFKSLLIFFFLVPFCPMAQTESENQYWNEFQFNRAIKGKFATEVDLDQSFTSGTHTENPFYRNSQLSANAWIHYYASARWKFSYALGYFYNREVPEINQTFSPEIRNSMQAIYYIRKIRYTLTNKLLLEDRHMQNSEGYLEGVYRLREMVKLLYPINGKQIRKGIVYGIASEEVFIKSKSSVTGDELFDRNRLTVGFGYSFTDNLQLEVVYVNDYLPRTATDKIYNAISTTIVFNNLIPVIQDKLKRRAPVTVADE